MNKIALTVVSRAAPGRRDELFELYLEHLAPRAEANDGQEVVVWCADQHDDDRFVLFEIYSDAESLGANASADWFSAYMAKAMPLLAGEPTVMMTEPRWSTGL